MFFARAPRAVYRKLDRSCAANQIASFLNSRSPGYVNCDQRVKWSVTCTLRCTCNVFLLMEEEAKDFAFMYFWFIHYFKATMKARGQNARE